MIRNWHQWKLLGTKERKKNFDHRSHHVNSFSWFCQYKSKEIREHTLRCLREEVGLGSPPMKNYTNENESINAFLKESVNYKKQQWAVFNQKMKKLVEQQQREVEKAVIGCGKYRLRPEYIFLAVDEEKLFRMTEAQRLRHLKKLITCSIRDSQQACSTNTSNDDVQQNSHDITVGQFRLGEANSLSVSYEEAITDTRIPKEIAERIWAKAVILTTESNAITFAPGLGTQHRMVKSTSGPSPYLVIAKESEYKCDEKCLQYKSLSICSHTVAVAESNGEL